MQVLVAEQSHLLRDRVARVLENQGHMVTCRTGGLRTLRTLQERKFDLLVLDTELPELSPQQILQHLPGLNKNVAVLVFYGLSRPTDLPEGVYYLRKPFTTASLLAACNALDSNQVIPVRRVFAGPRVGRVHRRPRAEAK